MGALIRVDLTSGDRTVLSIDGTPKGSPVFDAPIDVRYDACEKAFYVLQTGFGSPAEPGRVMKIDATTGVRTLFAKYQGGENYALLLRPIPVNSPVRAGAAGAAGVTDPPTGQPPDQWRWRCRWCVPAPVPMPGAGAVAVVPLLSQVTVKALPPASA